MTESRKKQNLAYIIANEEGQIEWNGPFGLIMMDPYVFRASFILNGGNLLFEKKDAPQGFRFKRGLTRKYYEETIENSFNPVKQIEIRRLGLLTGEAFPEICAYEEEQSKKLGYLLWLVDDNVGYLRNTGIGHKVVKIKEEIK